VAAVDIEEVETVWMLITTTELTDINLVISTTEIHCVHFNTSSFRPQSLSTTTPMSVIVGSSSVIPLHYYHYIPPLCATTNKIPATSTQWTVSIAEGEFLCPFPLKNRKNCKKKYHVSRVEILLSLTLENVITEGGYSESILRWWGLDLMSMSLL
jgi:hypothetical protein